jgi:hypothetical protein
MMEASGAGLAGGEGQAQQGADGGQEAGPDVGALASQLEAMQGSQEQMFQFLQSQPWVQEQQAQGEPEPAAEDFNLDFLDAASPDFDPSQVAERLSGLIDQAAQRHVQPMQQQLQQQQEALNEERWNREANALVQEFPDFGDPQIAEQIVGSARQIAEAYGQAELAQEPWFWRMTYMASRAAEAAAEEGAGAPDAAHLEHGGAAPAGSQEDIGDQIVNARRGSSVLNF